MTSVGGSLLAPCWELLLVVCVGGVVCAMLFAVWVWPYARLFWRVVGVPWLGPLREDDRSYGCVYLPVCLSCAWGGVSGDGPSDTTSPALQCIWRESATGTIWLGLGASQRATCLRLRLCRTFVLKRVYTHTSNTSQQVNLSSET